MKIVISLFIAVLAHFITYSQGCSDAGFCSLGALKNNVPAIDRKNSLAIGLNYGAGEQNTSTFSPYLEYAIKATGILVSREK